MELKTKIEKGLQNVIGTDVDHNSNIVGQVIEYNEKTGDCVIKLNWNIGYEEIAGHHIGISSRNIENE